MVYPQIVRILVRKPSDLHAWHVHANGNHDRSENEQILKGPPFWGSNEKTHSETSRVFTGVTLSWVGNDLSSVGKTERQTPLSQSGQEFKLVGFASGFIGFFLLPNWYSTSLNSQLFMTPMAGFYLSRSQSLVIKPSFPVWITSCRS